MSNVPRPVAGQPPPDSAPPVNITRSATSSLMLAVIAPASVYLTFPVALVPLIGAADAGGHTLLSWLAPLIFWSLPMLIGAISVSLAISTVRKLGRGSARGRVAVRSLRISGVVFISGVVVTLRFKQGMQYF